LSAKSDHIKVLMVDDHALFREGVVEIFAAEDDIQVVGEAENGAQAIALAKEEKPDVILLDIEMPVMGAERAIEGILRVSPFSKVLVLTMHDEPRLVQNLLTLGARAYVVKSATRGELLATVRTLARVENHVVLSVSQDTVERLSGQDKDMLSDRELEVLLLAARAMSNNQIASYLHISEGTVKRHFTNIFAKLGASSKADAIQKALKSRLITFRDLQREYPLHQPTESPDHSSGR
jgi:DNA-binding NarL/FixJ family response regulator